MMKVIITEQSFRVFSKLCISKFSEKSYFALLPFRQKFSKNHEITRKLPCHRKSIILQGKIVPPLLRALF